METQGWAVTGWLRPPLEGERVRLRPPAPGDEPALIEMATDTRVRRYLGGPADEATAAARAARKVTAPAWGQFVIVDVVTSQVVGSGSLARKRGPWEVSFQLRWQCCGNGFALEAVQLIRDWFFRHTTEDLLIATTQQANAACRRLLVRAGAVLAGTFEQYQVVQERYEFQRACVRVI
jgi:ribosomal-protein-alanine N-acetyltransferase